MLLVFQSKDSEVFFPPKNDCFHYWLHFFEEPLLKKTQEKKSWIWYTWFERSDSVSHRQFTLLVYQGAIQSFSNISFLGLNTTNFVETILFTLHFPLDLHFISYDTFVLLPWLHFKVIDKQNNLPIFMFYSFSQYGDLLLFLTIFFFLILHFQELHGPLQTVVSCSSFCEFGSKIRRLPTSSCSTCLAYNHIPHVIIPLNIWEMRSH